MRWKKVDENPNINKLMAIIYAETDREIDWWNEPNGTSSARVSPWKILQHAQSLQIIFYRFFFSFSFCFDINICHRRPLALLYFGAHAKLFCKHFRLVLWKVRNTADFLKYTNRKNLLEKRCTWSIHKKENANGKTILCARENVRWTKQTKAPQPNNGRWKIFTGTLLLCSELLLSIK